MIEFYRKNGVLFSVICIVVYVLVCGNLRVMGDDSPAMTAGLVVLAAALLAFVVRHGLAGELGLSAWAKNSRQMLYFLPLWIVSTGNLWGGVATHYEGMGLLCSVVSFALIGFVEELVFRGFLFREMLKSGDPHVAVAVSSITFGMGHIVNLLTGQGGIDTLVQVVFAIAMGFIFTFVYYKGGSLLPCIVAHSMIDVLSVFAGGSSADDGIYIVVTVAIAILYCWYLSRLETPAGNGIA